MSNQQETTVEDRLAKRRRLRNQRFTKNNTDDQAEIVTTQSIDRKPTTKSSSFEQHKLPSIQKSHSTPPQLQVPEKQHSINDKQTSTKPIVTQLVEKPVIIEEIVSKLAIVENHSVPQNEKPVVIKESITPVLPRTSNDKLNLIPQEIRGYSTPNQIKPLETYSQSTNDHSKPITRTISEEIVSMTTNNKHQPIGSIFAKHNSLAFPYLFNKRFIAAEMARASSLDSEQSRRKTVWD